MHRSASCPAALRWLLHLLPVLVALSSPAPSSAEEVDDDDPPHAEPAIDRLDRHAPDVWAVGGGAGPWVSVEGGLALRDPGKRVIGGMLLVGIPLDTWARRQTASASRREAARLDTVVAEPIAPPPAAEPPAASPPESRSDADSPSATVGRELLAQSSEPVRLKPAKRRAEARRIEPEEPAPPQPPPGDRGIEAPLPRPVVVTPEVARAAVRAGLRQARLVDAEARLGALASRARSSALLPELRLRATRLVDEAESLSPTEYDPGRTTATGGTSLWLEARATWRLDRLVFADEEVALERMRHDRADAELRVATRVLELLFAWQRASAAEADPARTPEEHLDATLRVLESEAALDVMTDGWFSRWRDRGKR